MLRRSFLRAGVLLTALTALGPVAAAEALKLTADDYIEIQQLYANYAQALDSGDGERSHHHHREARIPSAVRNGEDIEKT